MGIESTVIQRNYTNIKDLKPNKTDMKDIISEQKDKQKNELSMIRRM